jgi:hypothetical protein
MYIVWGNVLIDSFSKLKHNREKLVNCYLICETDARCSWSCLGMSLLWTGVQDGTR